GKAPEETDHIKVKTPIAAKQSGFSGEADNPQQGRLFPLKKNNRITVEVNMKDGLKIDAPASDKTGKSVDLVLKALALMIVLYGVAKIISAIALIIH
ncbi:hypothetical protein RDB90_005725, partial [Salmonella enterica]|nr:hypothetical protein [Salmonella enterica]